MIVMSIQNIHKLFFRQMQIDAWSNLHMSSLVWEWTVSLNGKIVLADIKQDLSLYRIAPLAAESLA